MLLREDGERILLSQGDSTSPRVELTETVMCSPDVARSSGNQVPMTPEQTEAAGLATLANLRYQIDLLTADTNEAIDELPPNIRGMVAQHLEPEVVPAEPEVAHLEVPAEPEANDEAEVAEAEAAAMKAAEEEATALKAAEEEAAALKAAAEKQAAVLKAAEEEAAALKAAKEEAAALKAAAEKQAAVLKAKEEQLVEAEPELPSLSELDWCVCIERWCVLH